MLLDKSNSVEKLDYILIPYTVPVDMREIAVLVD